MITQKVSLGELPFAAGLQSISSFSRHFTLMGAGRLEIMLHYGYKAGNNPKSIYDPAFNFYSSLEVSAIAPSSDGSQTRRFDAFEIARPGGNIGSFAEGTGSMFVSFENFGNSAMDVMLTDFSRVNIANAQWGQPVPEPETYAMMLAGLGVVGFAIRKRRRAMADIG
ncbi:PEPxxWA-CTERM sorting domain-containing protein [Chitinivorax sp. B]|uniref:PEPxxWA-CTERM sorting domain-containing protein n=1 Tax=Chitinivorax sp. B TaxID=2502235 RepID=UPI0020179056|nr:PEPxxWA-CTERM sorting domain-containing protein [Chitinivorax sp. B]